MSLTGKEVAQMHKDYVMQSWARSGADTLPVERAEGIYFTIMMEKNMQIWLHFWCVPTSDMSFRRSLKRSRNRLIRCASWHRHMHPSLRACWQKCL